MNKNDDNIKLLYNELKDTYDVGSEDDFRQYLNDADNREALRKELSSVYDVGDTKTFDDYLGFTKPASKGNGLLSRMVSPIMDKAHSILESQPQQAPVPPSNNAEDYAFTESQLENGKSAQAQPQQRDFSQPIDLSRPQEDVLRQSFKQEGEFAKHMSQYPGLNKVWAQQQEYANRLLMEPTAENFDDRMEALRDAKTIDAERQMNRGEFDKANQERFNKLYDDVVSPYLEEERQAADKRAREEVLNNIRKEIGMNILGVQNPSGVQNGVSRAFQTSVAVERETDPAKIAANTIKRVQGNDAFTDYILSRMGINGNATTNNAGESEELTEREKEYMQMLFSLESSEVADQMVQRIYDQYKAEGAPQSALDYIAGKAFRENFVASLYDALVRRAANSSGIREQLRAMASEEYGQDAGWMTRVAGGAAPFAVDMLTGGFAAPNAVGQALIKGGTRLAAKEVTKEMAKRATSRGLEDAALKEAVAGGAEIAERYIATQAPILNLALRTAGSAANFATYETQTEAVRQLSEGEFNAGNLVKQAIHGATLGSLMGATGGMIANATRNSGLAGKILGDITGLSTETGIFAAANGIEKARELGIDITDVDWADTTGEALGMVVGMKGVGAIMHPKQTFVNRYRQSKDLGLQLDQRDIDELKNAGYDLSSIFKGLGEFGKLAPESATVTRRAAEYTTDENGKRTQRNTETQEAYVDADAYNAMLNNPELSSSIKRKLVYIATGKVLSIEPVFGASMDIDENDHITITTKNAYGNPIETKEYANQEEAQKEYQVLQELAMTNTVGGLERIADKAGFEDVKETAKSRTQSETGVDVDDINKLSDLDTEDANSILNTYIKNLQDAYMERFNENVKRIEGTVTNQQEQAQQRTERRQAAYERGATVDEKDIATIGFEGKLAEARMIQTMPDGSQQEAIRKQIMDAVEQGDIESAERIFEQQTPYLDDRQRQAIDNYLDIYETGQGFDNAFQQKVEAYQQAKRDMWTMRADSKGNVTALHLKDGSTVYYQSGDLNGLSAVSSIFVTDDNGESKQISKKDILEIDEPAPVDYIISADVQAYTDALAQRYNNLADGGLLTQNQEADIMMGNQMFHVVCAGQDVNGNNIIQMPDGSRMAMTPDQTRDAVDAADFAKIQQLLTQEQEAVAIQQRTERFNNGIVGYANGAPNLSAKDTKPEVAAEYLLSQTDEQGQPMERKAVLDGIQSEVDKLAVVQERLLQGLQQARNNISMAENDEERQLSEDAERQLLARQEEIAQQRRKWGEIRQAMMTDEERQAFEKDRIKTINNAKSQAKKDIQPAGVEPLEVVGAITVKDILDKYEERSDADAYVEEQRKQLSQAYKNDVYPKWDDIQKTLNDYQHGLIDLTPEQVNNLAVSQARLETQMDYMVQQQNALKKMDAELSRAYTAREKAAMSPHELALNSLAKETDKAKKVKLAREAFKDDADALAALDDMEPQDVYEYVAENLGKGSINWEGKSVGEHYVRGLRDDLGKDKTRGIGAGYDTNGFNYYLAPEGQGKGIDEVIHNIAEGSPYDTQDVRNALLSMLTDAKKPTDISHRIVDERIAQAENIYEVNLEREREAQEEAARLAEQEALAAEQLNNAKAVVDGLNQKYHSLAPIEVLDSTHPTDEQMESILNRKLTAEELEDGREFLRNLNRPAIYSPFSKKIFIFADQSVPSELEEHFFHENIHRGLEQYYGDNLIEVAEAFWNTVSPTNPDGTARRKAAIIEKYADEDETTQHEEYLVHALSYQMTTGTVSRLLDRMSPEHRKIVTNILKNIKYDPAKEATTRGAELPAENEGLAGVRQEDAQGGNSVREGGGVSDEAATRETEAQNLEGNTGEAVHSAEHTPERRVNKSSIQGLESYSEDEIKQIVRDYVEKWIDEVDSPAEIVDIALIGSRVNGTAQEDSDLDVLVEYKGNETEDGLFNLLNYYSDEPLFIEGIKVDINPITEGKSGTIAQFLERNKDYKKEEETAVAQQTTDENETDTEVTGTETKGEDLMHVPFADRLHAAKGETNTNPTEEQKKAGNYKMGHIRFGGYRMSIENPKGSTRSGVDANGTPWSIEMQDTYGYIGQKYGVDGDHLDFFINDDADLDKWNGRVYVVDQKNEDGTFDEHKVMYGYPTWSAARKAYERNYEDGWWDKHVMQMTGMLKENFDKWLSDSDHKTKPFAEYARTKNSTTVSNPMEQLMADVEERENLATELQGTVAPSYKDGELEAKSIDELKQLRKKRNADRATAKVLLGTTNIQKGGLKERTLQKGVAQAEADMAAIDKVLEQKQAEQKTRIEQQEIGGAMVDQLERMGFDVTANISAMRQARKQAEKDNSEEGKLRHFKTSDGQIYGFTYKGKMYLDPRKIDANLPIHEYAHPWCEAFRRLNPEGWKGVVDIMRSDKDTWDFVKALNPDLKNDDDIAEEMIARGSGEAGQKYAQAEYERMNQRDPEYKSKWGNIWKNISKAIQDFWKHVGDFLHIKYESAEQVYDQVVRDFANKINPRTRIEQWLKERDKTYMEAVNAGDDAKAKELFDDALRENIGNGMTPFIAAGGYRKMRTLAHNVKNRDPKVIAKVADLMAPLIPKDAVLVPAPSHTGKATDMLDLAQAISERTGAPVADVLTSKERSSQYEAKYAGKPIAAKDMGITKVGELPEGKMPVVIDNVVDTGNTAEACIQALGKGIVASLADSVEIYKHVASLKSAEPVVTDKKGNVVPLSERFDFMIEEGNLFSDEDFEEPSAAVVQMPQIDNHGFNLSSALGKRLAELKKQGGPSALVGYTTDDAYVFVGDSTKAIGKLNAINGVVKGERDGMVTISVPNELFDRVSPKLVKNGHKMAFLDNPDTEPSVTVAKENEARTYNVGDKIDVLFNGQKHQIEVLGVEPSGDMLLSIDGLDAFPTPAAIFDEYVRNSEKEQEANEPKSAVDNVLEEADRRQEEAKAKKEAEKTIKKYVDSLNIQGDEMRQRATKAVLTAMDNAGVPYKVVSKEEERQMTKLFSLMNKEAVKDMARKYRPHAIDQPTRNGRYIVYNMNNPFGVPMYFEKLSTAKYGLQGMKNLIPEGDWAILDIGLPGEETKANGLKDAADMQAMMGWHGSGAKFDAFDHRHMGSGEGNQTYGWGTYITEVEGIGRMYAKAIGDVPKTFVTHNGKQVDVNRIRLNDLENKVGRALSRHDGYKGPTIASLENEIRLKENQLNNLPAEEDLLERSDFEKDIDFLKACIESLKNDEWTYRYQGPQHFLYKVDIPEDTGENYLDWTKPLPKERAEKILADVRERLLTDDKYGWKGNEEMLDKQLAAMKDFFGETFYWRVATLLGNSVAGAHRDGHRITSDLFSKYGYVGVKYPAEYRSGGRKDDAKNYVIFNEDDAKITDTIQFMIGDESENGQPMFQKEGKKILGWSDGKQVYLTQAGLNPNTPLHECTHLWDKWCQKEQPELWSKLVSAMKKTKMWEDIASNPNYRNIWNDENRMASEVHSRLTGTEGEEEFMRAAFKKGTSQKIIDEVKSVLRKFWERILQLFGKHTKTIGDDWNSLDAIIRMPIRDLVNQDFEKVMKVATAEPTNQLEAHIVTGKTEIERLEREPKEVGYRNVVLNEDGTLGSPMANRLGKKGAGRKATTSFEYGKWERSDENPDLADENGKINLIKPNGKPVEGVDYNPYIHIRPNKVNKQFKEAWRRPELIYVETEYPKSELEGGYQAEKAAKAVGRHPWGNKGEELILSRWDKPVRMVPWEEVADDWEKEFAGRGVEFDIIPPALLPILSERGVEILPPHKGCGKECEEAYKQFIAKNPDIRYRRVTPVENKANMRYNKQLEEFAAGKMSSGRMFELGAPSPILRTSGITGRQIKMKQSVLSEHMKKHDLTFDDLKDMPSALYHPMMVYQWGDKARSHVVITELTTHDGRKVTLTIRVNNTGDILDVEKITSVHGKDLEHLIREMNTEKSDFAEDNLTYVNKEKALEWLTIDPPVGSRITSQELNSAAKIIKDFDNSKFTDEKLREIFPEEVAAVEEVANQLGGVKVTLEAVAPEKGTLGWYDPNDNTVHLVVPEHADVNEVMRTVFHEKLGHEGLVALLGSQAEVNKFGSFIFDSAGKVLRKRIMEKADEVDPQWTKHDRFSTAAQEVMGDIAANGPRTEEEFSLWTKVKHYLIRLLNKLNIRIPGLLNDKDLSYYILKTGEALKKWNSLDEAEKQNISAQADEYEILRSRRGKPRKRNNESDAQYFQRLREWEKWRAAVQRAKDNGDPEPEEQTFHEQAETAFKADLEEWRRHNGITATSMSAYPRREDGESPQDFAIRVAEWETQNDIWKTAPKLIDYLAEANRKYRQAYTEWRERYDLEEQASVDQRLYEGDINPAPTYTDADMEAEALAEKDLAEAVGMEVDEDGAKRHAKLAVIERRKNMESSNAEDAIWVYDFVKQSDDVAAEIGRRTGEQVTGKELRAALPFLIEADRRRENMEAERDEAVMTINMSDAIQQAHSFVDFRNIDEISEELLELNEAYQRQEEQSDTQAHQAYREAAARLADKLNALNEGMNGYNKLFSDDIMQIRSLLTSAAAAGRGDVMPEYAKRFEGVPEVLQLMEHIKDWYDEFYQVLEDAGLRGDAGYIDDGYVNHVWDKEKSDPKAWEQYIENRQRTKSPNMRHREIDTYMDGISIGLVPKYTDIADMIAHYSRQNNEAVANRRFLDDLQFIVVDEMNDAGEVTAILPLVEFDKPNSFVRERYTQYYVPGVGDIYVLNHIQKRFANIFGTMRTPDAADWLSKLAKGYDLTSSTAKKIQLALSGFHALALFEVDMAQNNPAVALKHLFKYIITDSIKSGTLPAYAHPEDFQLAAKHLVQLGATEDYAASDVNAITQKMRDAFKDWSMSDESWKKAAGTVGSPVAILMDWVNKGFDTVLWNYLHDGLKLCAFRELAKQVERRVAKEGLDNATREQLLDEAGQYVNDMFGGQYWELINVSPATLKWMRRAFLSPDWLVSTQRHFFANFGFGSVYSDSAFANYIKYNTDNIKRVFGADVPKDELRRLRSKNAKYCYLVGAMVWWGLFYNAINALCRWKDEDDEKKKAEEERKTNPNYKSPYELAYPDGMKWYDYTMYGNTIGQNTHLFTGRYSDGTETYVRWGKQFREFPELFIGRHGLEFPAPIIQRMMAKGNPNIGTAIDFLGAQNIGGFNGSYENKELREKYGKTVATLAAMSRHFIPFGMPTQAEKEYKLLDFFMPSSKGFSRWKAKDYFETFIMDGDWDGIEQTYNACVMNGIDAEKNLDAAIASIKAAQRHELSDNATDLSTATMLFDAATDPKDRQVYLNKIKKYLKDGDYNLFTKEEAMEKVHAFLDGTDAGEKENARYVMLATSKDIIAEEKLKDLGRKARQFKKELEAKHDTDEYDALKERYGSWLLIDKKVNKAVRAINKSKKQLGGDDDETIMNDIRQTIRDTNAAINELQEPK